MTFKIPKEEFAARAAILKDHMRKAGLDLCFIYGDEYRRENLRYIADYWPIFERGAAVIPAGGEPIILGAPEGEELCREMSAWEDIRLVDDFLCVTVPDEIEYPFANYTTFKKVFDEFEKPNKRIGVSGIDAMPKYLYDKLKASAGCDIVDINDILYQMRLVKSDHEIGCLRRAAQIADIAYEAMMKAAVPGVTELHLAGVAVGEAMKHGSENVPFCLVSSGHRVNTIIGRATGKVVEDGDMVMAALAVQYEGYIASVNIPFVAGKASDDQKEFISWLAGAYRTGMQFLRAGARQAEFVRAIKGYFKEKNLTKYDLYPPLHGCGLSEAESPYPNEHSTGIFKKGMTVNTDISIFGHPLGSNRIEGSFVIGEDACEPLSKLLSKFIEE